LGIRGAVKIALTPALSRRERVTEGHDEGLRLSFSVLSGAPVGHEEVIRIRIPKSPNPGNPGNSMGNIST
jgi:hypothetical protein